MTNFILMHEASLQGFLKVIFYILVTWYVVRFLARLLLPLVVKKVVQKAEENFNQQYGHHQRPQQSYTHTTTSTNQRPRETKKVGEYVDYEEID